MLDEAAAEGSMEGAEVVRGSGLFGRVELT